MYKKENNYAFIDGQNLHLSTIFHPTHPWEIDLKKFYIYLQDKYCVSHAYYFLGYVQEGLKAEKRYESIQEAGFILKFRQHSQALLSKKKGNVDVEIVISIFRKIYYKDDFNSVVLVTGDGDYKSLVDFLIDESRLKKILFPYQKKASSLYNRIPMQYKADLDPHEVRIKIS